jgi:hypothetical protein
VIEKQFKDKPYFRTCQVFRAIFFRFFLFQGWGQVFGVAAFEGGTWAGGFFSPKIKPAE